MTIEEARAAYRYGVERNILSRHQGRTHRFGWSPSLREQRYIDGMSAVAECLVSSETGRAWMCGFETDDPNDGDVHGGISVRWTPRHSGCLIVHEDEPANLRAVLVVGPRPQWMRIVGWVRIRDAQNPAYWRTGVRHPAFFVPQSAPIWRDIRELAVAVFARAEVRP